MRATIEGYLLTVAVAVASRSTCRRQVGCVLADVNGRILSTGYNGKPKGFAHCDENSCTNPPGSGGTCHVIHAEQNAALFCTQPNEIHYIAVTRLPCMSCGLLLMNTPGKVLIFEEENSYPETVETLQRKFELVHLSALQEEQ